MAFSPDAQTLAAVGDDCHVHLLRATDLHPRSKRKISDKALYAVAFHPTKNLLAAGGEDGKVYFLATGTGTTK